MPQAARETCLDRSALAADVMLGSFARRTGPQKGQRNLPRFWKSAGRISDRQETSLKTCLPRIGALTTLIVGLTTCRALAGAAVKGDGGAFFAQMETTLKGRDQHVLIVDLSGVDASNRILPKVWLY